MLCPTCGSYCEDHAQQCPVCGNELNAQQPVTEAVNDPIVTTQAPVKKSKASLVLGIIALADAATLGCLCSCLGSFPGIVCAIIGLILGLKEKKVNPDNGANNTGVVLCIVALVVAVVFIVINAVLGGLNGLNSFASQY